MTPPKGAGEILSQRGQLQFVIDILSRRAQTHAQTPQADQEALRLRVKDRVTDLLDEWEYIANDNRNVGVQLQYQKESGAAQPLLHDFLDPELKKKDPRYRKFRAHRSMRDVEANVNLWMRTMDNIEVEEDEE
jgi:hypothetical protein